MTTNTTQTRPQEFLQRSLISRVQDAFPLEGFLASVYLDSLGLCHSREKLMRFAKAGRHVVQVVPTGTKLQERQVLCFGH